MTPKEKAIDLFNKYFDLVEAYSAEQQHENARTAAIIAVDEFLSFQESLYITEGSLAYQYWQQVKQEIEKI
jgi:hypothetical protein